jgi:hypothetical protein
MYRERGCVPGQICTATYPAITSRVFILSCILQQFYTFLYLAAVSRLLWYDFRGFHSQDTFETKYILMPRRGSSSIGETIVHDSVELAGTRARSSITCWQCKKLVSDTLISPFNIFFDNDVGHTKRTRDNKSGRVPWAAIPVGVTLKNEPDPRKISGIQDLQNSARECSICSLLWQILRWSDNTLLDQVLRYSNDEFNATSRYFSDGGTHVEEIAKTGSRVNISASANLEYPGLLQSSRSHASPRRRQENLHIPRIRTYRTPSLRLQLTVAFKAQPGSRQSSNTTVQEELTIFWSSGI